MSTSHSTKASITVAILTALFTVLGGHQAFIHRKQTIPHHQPKLVLAVVFDQLRSDDLNRFRENLLPARLWNGRPGGFEYLTQTGANFPFAEHTVLQSLTAPGHAAILSGAHPSQHGVPLNYFFDRATEKPSYCVADPDSPIVGNAQGTKGGISPRSFFASTLGDEMKNTGFDSKVVSVALKDRAAVLLGGHEADLTFWFNDKSWAWVSSSFYLPEGKLPDWLEALNQELSKNPGKIEDLETEIGHTLTLQAAVRALEAFELGNHRDPDLLAVSFSSHDLSGHKNGPNAGVRRTMVEAADRTLSRLLSEVEKRVPGGLDNVLVMLTGDHGVGPIPEFFPKGRVDSGRLNEEKMKQELQARLSAKFGSPGNGIAWIPEVHDFNFWIHPEALRKTGASKLKVEAEIKSYLLGFSEFLHVLTASEIQNWQIPQGILEERLKTSWFQKINGDVIALVRPHFQPSWGPAYHFTSYTYDRMIPLLFAGPGIKPGTYSTQARAIDIAPTLSFILRVIPPNMSEGRVLSEVLQAQ